MKRNLRWLIPLLLLIVLVIYLLSSSGMGKITTDFARAYANKSLYTNAIEKANSNPEILEILGPIKPIDKMAIINGEVQFTDNNKRVNTSIKIVGENRKAHLDIKAKRRKKEPWEYQKIIVRVNYPEHTNRIIKIIEDN